MSKELTPLQALENIIETFFDKDSEDIRTVRKALKALEIIKNKGVAVGMIQLEEVGLREYNDFIGDKNLYLDKTEYELLRKVLK